MQCVSNGREPGVHARQVKRYGGQLAIGARLVLAEDFSGALDDSLTERHDGPKISIQEGRRMSYRPHST